MALPPPQPVYVLRGHASTIHSLLFMRDNTRLVSGDASGWLVVWDVALKRPTAVWKAHNSVILGIEAWEEDKLITQGRDGKIIVWQLRQADEAGLSKQLPVEDEVTPRKQPWLLHSLPVSDLTFCSFATRIIIETSQMPKGILLATPGTSDSTIHLTHLPSERIIAQIPAPAQSTGKTGMIMALRVIQNIDGDLLVLAGYESGRTYVFKHLTSVGSWQIVYTARPHDQPVLSLDVAPAGQWYLTSGADAVIARHSLLNLGFEVAGEQEADKIAKTGHAGQQGLRVRGDGKVFATAGWDGKGRVYSGKTMREVAVCKWHKEGCYAIAFAETDPRAASDGSAAEVEVEQAGLVRGESTVTRSTVEQKRNHRAQTTHWLALGSKDGKISLWDIF